MAEINPSIDPAVARQLLELCMETGAEEPIGEMPVNRFKLLHKSAAPEVSETKRKPDAKPAPARTVEAADDSDPVRLAENQAASCGSLDELRQTIAAYPHCGLRDYARNLVFADGIPEARVMVVGEAPGADEDRQGKPFVGRAGWLLDRMLAEIGLRRDSGKPENAFYVTNVIPWRPPGNRNPEKKEIAMMAPFAVRHVEIVNPDILVAVGNFSCSVFIGQTGVTRLRGNWAEWRGIPVMPMFHPAYLLRSPEKKRDSWHDLLMIRQRLKEI